MPSFHFIVLAALGLLFVEDAVSAPMPRVEAMETVQPTPTRTYSTSGSLYGPTSLLGEEPSAPLSTQNLTVPENEIEFAPGQKDDTTGVILNFENLSEPQPIVGDLGDTDPGPRQNEIYRFHPDILAPPPTDSAGDIPQLQWPISLSNMYLGSNNAGWSRQQNEDQLPASTDFAGVNMRLAPGAYRELHWHTADEFAIVLNGSMRVQAINEDKQTFIDDLNPGDLWYFPAGVPHYLQGLENGTEFLLIFDSGDFSEQNTFMLRNAISRDPLEALSKDMDLPTDAFTRFPTDERFIFNGTVPSNDISTQTVVGPAGQIPNNESFSFHWSEQVAQEVPGGSVKLVDTTTFPALTDISSALVTIKPGAMREIHWHPSSMEWSFFLQGAARMTVYDAPDSSETFDYRAGDIGLVPQSATHYIENIGDIDVIFMEVLKQPKFTDFSVAQMLGLLPPQVTKDHLGLTDEEIEHLSKEEPYVVQGQVPYA